MTANHGGMEGSSVTQDGAGQECTQQQTERRGQGSEGERDSISKAGGDEGDEDEDEGDEQKREQEGGKGGKEVEKTEHGEEVLSPEEEGGKGGTGESDDGGREAGRTLAPALHGRAASFNGMASAFHGLDLTRSPSLKSLPPPLPLYYDRGHADPPPPLPPPPPPLLASSNPDPLLGPSDAVLRRLLHWEMTHPLDEGGEAKLSVKQSTFPGGGLGCFATNRPAPLEYVRDHSLPRAGFLTQEESDTQWEEKAEGSTYIMEVTLGADWFRDEVEGNGRLRPMQELHRYVWQGRVSQQLRWDHGSCQYVFLDKNERALYKGLLDPLKNAAPFMNDALFGRHDGDSDEYEAEDELRNAFTMVPCLRSSPAGGDKVELSSVWYYPRVGWDWGSSREQEVTCGYHWPLEDWMRPAAGDDTAAAPAPATIGATAEPKAEPSAGPV